MKTAKEWVKEYSVSGPFDNVISCKEAEQIVQQIQNDALGNVGDDPGLDVKSCLNEEVIVLSGGAVGATVVRAISPSGKYCLLDGGGPNHTADQGWVKVSDFKIVEVL